MFFACAIIVYPERYVPRCYEGIVLWAECVLPSLFPFMVITMLLTKTGIAQSAAKPLSRLTGRLKLPKTGGVIFAMSVCSGYPAGSRIIAEYYDFGCIGRKDSKKLALLCSTSGPLFIVGSVGFKMFTDKTAGLKIMLAHVLSVLIIALIYSLKSPADKSDKAVAAKTTDNALYDSFYSGVISVLVAGGFIAFFYTLAGAISDFNLLLPLRLVLTPLFGQSGAEALCYGLIEATGGCAMMAGSDSVFSLPAAGFMITFGGASILLQQLCYLVKCGVGPFFFIGFKFLQGLLCFALLVPLALL